ncbi:amidohydrolase [Anaerovorax odorimutans]|uniref:Amidohydrolase n=1 Tax=Anaerovorax odorimutans TaxID=109327 RepID=A0ABT1RJ42_9FIRM|nr:amidohydrolase [Anaerovorax odorimutans]MCQ4635188.1 amidohydrolase [Anaerovorax odorimutans]
MKYDLIIKNANIISMDQDLNRYDWLAVSDQTIARLGQGQPQDEAVRTIDAAGATVLPGLTDCHVHVLNAGINLNGVDLQNCADISEVLSELKERCRAEDGNGWIYGVNYVPQNIKENRYPTRWELDEICEGHKVVIFAATLHGCAVNSQGVEVAQVPEDYPGVEKTEGIASGVYSSDESSFLATANILGSLSDDELWKFIKDCAEYAASQGATTIHGLFGQFVKDDRDLDLILDRGSQLAIDIVPFYQTWDVRKALDRDLPRVGGCLTLDGALFEYTMANFEPFVTAPELRGVLYHNDDEVYKVVSEAHRAGIQCSMHAVGERAIDQLIYTYYRVIREQGQKDLRHRIEHFCLPTKGQIQMAADLDLIISMQPGFTYLWDKKEGGEFEMILGRERADRWDPFNRIIEKGITVIGGSDCPVTPIDPLTDIATCVNGDNPIRNISVTEALKMYTSNAAYSVRQEDKKGTVEIGKQADLVIIDRDPYEYASAKEIYDMEALCTIKNGKVIYSKQDF